MYFVLPAHLISVTFQVLRGHMWLVATTLDRAGQELDHRDLFPGTLPDYLCEFNFIKTTCDSVLSVQNWPRS